MGSLGHKACAFMSLLCCHCTQYPSQYALTPSSPYFLFFFKWVCACVEAPGFNAFHPKERTICDQLVSVYVSNNEEGNFFQLYNGHLEQRPVAPSSVVSKHCYKVVST